VLELALAAAESGVDLAQALRLGKLAEEHGDEVVPAGKALGPAFAAGFADESGEAIAIDERKKLAEKTGGGYIHCRPPCSECDWFFIHPDSIRSGRVFQSAILDSSGTTSMGSGLARSHILSMASYKHYFGSGNWGTDLFTGDWLRLDHFSPVPRNAGANLENSMKMMQGSCLEERRLNLWISY
jgi:hypothetical protein